MRQRPPQPALGRWIDAMCLSPVGMACLYLVARVLAVAGRGPLARPTPRGGQREDLPQ